MKKVISFSLWGDNPTYTIGAIKNAELAKVFYPFFECWFYIHEETVPKNIIDYLSSLSNTKIILRNGNLINIKPMMWRFEAIDDPEVEIMISRDTDTRFLLREKLAVYEWINSNKVFHIMRDHPHHNFKILGGMFGTKKIEKIPSWIQLMNIFQQNNLTKGYDQNFLGDYIYPFIKDNCIIHSTFNKYEDTCKNFPINYDDEYKFVGEYIYHDESRSTEHINILKNSLDDNDKNKIHLITSFYIVSGNDDISKKRNNELLECLYNNLHNDTICKIHLFVDNIEVLNKVLEINFNNKIKIINIGNQPLYSDMFEYAINNLKDYVCMISNSDIYLHKCDLNVLNKLKKNIFALSRHENDFKCHVFGSGSYDAFIFNPIYIKKDILENIKHIQNLAGSDDNIVNNLIEHGFNLYNPCFEIMIIHLHNSQLRTYNTNKIANGKYLIKQEYLLKNNYKKNNYIYYNYYPGVDHLGDDIYYVPGIELNLEKLKEIADNDINVVSYNTLGFFKKNVDYMNLKETEYVNKKNAHGIFIKKYETEYSVEEKNNKNFL